MDENKSMSLAVLGVVAVIAVVSVVLLLTNAQTTGLNVGVGDKVYGGDLQNPGQRYYDVQATRFVGSIEQSVGTERAAAGGTPYRTYNRAQSEVPSLLTACQPPYTTADFNQAEGFRVRTGTACLKLNGAPDGTYCCPQINYAKGKVIVD